MNKINDEMFKSDQNWMTISNTSHMQDNSRSNHHNPSEAISNLIDTFTGSIDENQSYEKLDTYRVKSEVGTMIAQKLVKGDKIRVCRNGEPINDNNDLAGDEYFTDSKYLGVGKKRYGNVLRV